MASPDGIAGTDDVTDRMADKEWLRRQCGIPEPKQRPAQTRHHEYAGRYEMIRAMLQKGHEPMMGQIALIALDMLEEFAGLRRQIEELNATNLELIVHRRVK